MGVRNYWENGSVIGYPPYEIPGAHRTEALTEPSVWRSQREWERRPKFANPTQTPGERRPKFGFRSLDASPPRGRGGRNSPTAGGTASETSKPTTPLGERRPKFAQIQEERR